MQLSDEQQAVFVLVKQFVEDVRSGRSSKRYFTIQGLAGTGKTALGVMIVKWFEGLAAAYTGRAAANFGAKCGCEGMTVHGLLYWPEVVLTPIHDKAGKVVRHDRELKFVKKDENSLRGEVVVLDECSLINEKMAGDLLATGAIVIALGDPGQLKPIGGAQFFVRADAELLTIHRQAADSAIIRQAHRIRHHGLYQADTDDFRVVGLSGITDAMLLDADAVIVWKKKTRDVFIDRIRQLRGFEGDPKAGEPVMCVKNAPLHGVCNGIIYPLALDWHPKTDARISIMIGGSAVSIPSVGFCADQADLQPWHTTGFWPGYAMTCHKSQGSEFDKVFVYDEYPARGKPEIVKDRRSWLYTAATRAKQSVVMAR